MFKITSPLPFLALLCVNVLAIGWLMFGRQTAQSMTLCPHRPADTSGSDSWKDNKFSSATSGKLFQMRVSRQYSGEIKFAKSSAPSRLRGDGEGLLPRLVDFQCAIWAVVTTISSPTTTVLQLARLAEEGSMCLVIVGDRKTPQNYTLGANSIYLSPEAQEKLPYSVVRHLPWNHFGRKNVGFLFAIHHGAAHIYDTDDDNELLAHLTRLPIPETSEFGTFLTKRYVMNPYPCFASEESETQAYAFSWPRGFPLSRIKDPSTVACEVRDATQRESESVGVVQSLANHDPDVDAIYRMTRPLPIAFNAPEKAKRAAIVPPGTFVPYNAQATLYTRRAMWGLLLPITVHGRVSDIWRGYFTQSVMWQAGLTLAMASPWVIQKRNAHTYLGDLQAEQNLYYQADAILEYLTRARVSRSTVSASVAASIEDLHVCMYENGVIEMADVELAQAWLADLQSAGYDFPEMAPEATRPVSQDTPDDGASGVHVSAQASVFERPKLNARRKRS